MQPTSDDFSIDLLISFDEETGFLKTPYFVERLDTRLFEAGTDSFIAVVQIQLDHLRELCDSLGPGAMSSVLATVAATWRVFEHEGWLVGRSGHDRFLLATPVMGSLTQVVAAVHGILDLMAEPLVIQDMELHVRAALGVAVAPDHGAIAAVLVESARLALLHAQTHHADGFCMFDPLLGVAAKREARMLMDLRSSLNEQQMSVVYAPMINLHTEQIVGVTASLQWQHPELGVIPADVFLPLSELHASSIPFGDYLWRQATAEMVRLQKKLPRPLRLSIKVTAQQIRQSQGMERFTDILKNSGFDARLLEIEISERALLCHDECVWRTLDHLRVLGVTIAMADFGEGQANLLQLKRYPIDTVKISPAFIERVATHASDHGIVRAMIAMAHSLRMKIYAKGVQAMAQQHALARLGCDGVEGRLYGEAVLASLLPALLLHFAIPSLTPLPREAAEVPVLVISKHNALLYGIKRLLTKGMPEQTWSFLSAATADEVRQQLTRQPQAIVIAEQVCLTGEMAHLLPDLADLYPDTIRCVAVEAEQVHTINDALANGVFSRLLLLPMQESPWREECRAMLRQRQQAQTSVSGSSAASEESQLVRLNHMLEQQIMDRDCRIAREAERLQVIQEVVDKVYAGVLGVDCMADIVVANRCANLWLGWEGMTLVGQSIAFLPPLLSESIQNSLMATQPQESMIQFVCGDRAMRAVISPMGHQSVSKGVLVTLMECDS